MEAPVRTAPLRADTEKAVAASERQALRERAALVAAGSAVGGGLRMRRANAAGRAVAQAGSAVVVAEARGGAEAARRGAVGAVDVAEV